MSEQPMSFVVAMKHYFGLKPGGDNMSFLSEMRALDEADKAYFKAALEKIGYDIR